MRFSLPASDLFPTAYVPDTIKMLVRISEDGSARSGKKALWKITQQTRKNKKNRKYAGKRDTYSEVEIKLQRAIAGSDCKETKSL